MQRVTFRAHLQVLFDYECFAEFVATNYSASSDDDAVSGSYGGDD